MCYRLIERVFVFVLLLSSMTVVDALTRPALTQGRDPDVLSTGVPLPTLIIELAIYACGALLVLMRWRRVASAVRAVWPLVALGLVAIASTAWSDVPLLTVRRSVSLLGSTLIGIYLGERFSMEQLTRWLAQMLCLLMMGSILLYVISPASVFDYAYEGAWRGVTINKNTFGGYMAIAVVVLLLVRFRHFHWLRFVFLGMAAILLLLSHSATSLVGCGLIISMMPLWRLMRAGSRTRRVAYIVISLAIGVGIYFISVDRDLLFRVLGRDATLTGRTDLWALLMSAISKHPLLGYGYGAFWSGMQGEALNVYIGSRWLPAGAHNGYLELLLGIGVLGLPLLLFFVLRSFGLAKDYIRSNEGRLSLWPMSYLLLFVFHNFFESHLLETRSMEFLMFAAITTSLAMECSGRERRQAPIHPPLFVNHKQPA